MTPILFIKRAVIALLALSVAAGGGYAVVQNQPVGSGHTAQGGNYRVIGVLGQPVGRQNVVGGGFRINSGVLHEWITVMTSLYLPVVVNNYSSTNWKDMSESEPNNLFSQANRIADLPARVSGAHDGNLGTGDVFVRHVPAGQQINVSLATSNPAGVQLVVYNAAGQEVGRDFSTPFEVTFTASSTGDYYLYLYTPASANNTGQYNLYVTQVGQTILDEQPIAPMDDVALDQAPAIEEPYAP